MLTKDLKAVIDFNKKLNPYGFEVNSGLRFYKDRIENIGNNYFFIYKASSDVEGTVNVNKLEKFVRVIKSKEIIVEEKDESLLFKANRVHLQTGKFPVIDYSPIDDGTLLCTFVKEERKYLELLLSIISKEKAINPSFSGVTLSSNDNIKLYTTDVTKLARYVKEGCNVEIDLVLSKFFFDALILSLKYFDSVDLYLCDDIVYLQNDVIKVGAPLMAVDVFDFEEHFSESNSMVTLSLNDENVDTIKTVSNYSNNIVHFIATASLVVASYNEDNPTDIITGECEAKVNQSYSKIFNIGNLVKYLDLFNSCMLSEILTLEGDSIKVILSEMQ